MPVGLAAGHHGPGGPRHFVRQRDRGQLARPALEQLQQPVRGQFVARSGGNLDHGGGSSYQQLAQPFIASTADAAHALLATGRMFLWRQSEPGRQMTA